MSNLRRTQLRLRPLGVTAALALALALVLASCASNPSGAPDGAPDSGPPATNAPTTTGPAERCGPEVDPIGCGQYVGKSATDRGAAVEWIDKVTLRAMWVNDTVTLGIGTPCNGLGVPITIDRVNARFDLNGDIVHTLMACPEEATNQEKWVAAFFSQPVQFTVNAGTLVLTSGEQTITMEAATA